MIVPGCQACRVFEALCMPSHANIKLALEGSLFNSREAATADLALEGSD